MSTQVLTKNITLENKHYEHISSILNDTMTSHGLAAAILHAYINHHQHLRLTPDDIYCTRS
ncbi:hypothetical protein C1646_751927 [Rhizophagus diaphanus]|nr:hypothetical protein C1646_751927 [Rhizophagus diaphanus] [Rhizophagus sp. MUCL 43196]